MKKITGIFAFACALFLACAVHAKDSKSPDKEASAMTYNTKVAKVISVDQKKNTIDLEGEGGTDMMLQVDPAQVKNFKNIKKGDLVVVQTTQSTVLSLTKAKKGEKPSAEVISEKETAPMGSKPGMDSMKTAQITAEVVKVDMDNSTVDLKGPRGNVMTLKAKDPGNLKGIKKGDLVTATYSIAMAISVEPKK